MLESLPALNFAIGLASVAVLKMFFKQSELRRIPTAGFSTPVLSYITAFNFIWNARDIVQQGCEKFPNRVFKLANFTQWIVVVHGEKLVNELKNVPEDEMSFVEGIRDTVEIDYTMGPQLFDNPFHIHVTKTQLTRNLGDLCPILQDEAAAAFKDAIPLEGSEWLKLPVYRMVQDVICRISNRAFVGLPVCRDPDYRKLNITFTMDVIKDAAIIGRFPSFLKTLVTRLIGKTANEFQHGVRHIGPLVEERLAKIKEFGPDYPDKPVDFLSWLIDDATPDELNPLSLTKRVISTNFAAIHTSSMSFTHALYHLAAEPKYIKPLREEVEAVVREVGWTRNSVSKLHKVDSFLKESQRMNGIGCLVMTRKVVGKDYVFSDGTVVPVGTIVEASSLVHFDEDVYTNPHVFDGFRFSRMREEKSGSGNIPMTASTSEFLAFGLGSHACPGRMFAVNELKLMLAHLVLNYDVKLDPEGVRPVNVTLGSRYVPNMYGQVLFRKRED